MVKRRHLAAGSKDLRSFLLAQEKEHLVDLLVEHARSDESLSRKLHLERGTGGEGGHDLVAVRRAIASAVEVDVDDFDSCRHGYSYASGLYEVIDTVEGLLGDDGDHALEVIELCEEILAAVEEVIEYVDDDGEVVVVLDRVQALHLRACQAGRPDPEELARRLFTWELHDEWDVFSGAAGTYASVLERQGLAVYRHLAEEEWKKVPPLRPGDDRTLGDKRRALTRIMEALARTSGDLEALVAVKSRDLSSAYQYLKIAELYREAKQNDQALQWAEEGWKTFSSDPDERLVDFLCDEYQRRRRHDEALALSWSELLRRTSLENYERLHRRAKRARRWSEWREKAHGFLREAVAREKSAARQPPWGPIRSSLLVEVLLQENDVEEAWRQAQDSGCREDLWLALAARRETTHPADALPVYQRRIGKLLQTTKNDAYREAVQHLRKIKELIVQLERPQDFVTYLMGVRKEHGRKRNFIQLLDAARLA